MKDKPKLSAEMEKRFDEEFDHFVIDVGESGETVDWDRVKQFLATALEEQRKQILSEAIEVAVQLARDFFISKPINYLPPMVVTESFYRVLFSRYLKGQNVRSAELRAKLNQLKGTDEESK